MYVSTKMGVVALESTSQWDHALQLTQLLKKGQWYILV